MNTTRIAMFAAAAALFAGQAFAQAPAAAPVTPPNNSPPQAPAAADPAAPAGDAAAPAGEEAAAVAAPPSAAALAFRPLPAAAAAGNLQETLRAAGQFTKFLAAAEKTGLGAFLTGTRQLTIIAPTDAAFDTMGEARLEALMAANPASELQGILVRHIIATPVALDAVQGKKGPVPTAGGSNVEIDGSVTPMKFNEAVVLQAAVPASNGVIYVVDRLL